MGRSQESPGHTAPDFERFGVRQDLFQVGLDVWPYPEEPEASQRIAEAVKAALILMEE